MNETVITWTPQNWITVFLMVFIGFAVIGLGLRIFSKIRPQADEQ